MRILISGARIGGLALSSLLPDHHDVTLINKAPEWAPVGYFIALWPIGLTVLETIGIACKVRSHGVSVPGMHVHNTAGDELLYADFTNLNKKYGKPYSIGRSDLHRYLREANNNPIKLNTTIQSLEQDNDEVYVTFNNDEKRTYDLVIGSDGINSQVRNLVFPHIQPRYLGSTSWICWVPETIQSPESYLNIWGNGKSFSMYPTDKDGHSFAYFAMSEPPEEDDPGSQAGQLKEHFNDIDFFVPDVLEELPDDKELFHHDHEQIDAQAMSKNRVCLLGDAAHAVSPFLGLGASLAMEDAHVLTDKLTKTSVPDALQRYEQTRLPRLKHVQTRANIFDYTLKTTVPESLIPLRNKAASHILDHIYLNTINTVLKESSLNLNST